jgi:hypothetical protein
MKLGVGYSIEDFNGNFDELAALMRDSWGTNKEQALEYDSEFLRSALSYPGCSFDLAPAIYREGRLIAFIAASPRNVLFASQQLKLLNVSFLTVATEYKRRGFGPVIWREVMQRGASAGYDGTVNFCVEGDDMNGQMLALAAFCGQRTHRRFSVDFMARLLPAEENAPKVAVLEETEAEIFTEAARRVPEEVPFARLWTQEEVEWQCHRRSGALACGLNGERRGILAGYAIKTLGEPTSSVMIDDILWGDLLPAERVALARAFLREATERGARMAILPLLGYADIAPLTSLGFRKIRRTLHMYLTLWKDLDAAKPLSSIYIDVL